MARSRARLTLVVNRTRRPSPAAAMRAGMAELYAEKTRELKAKSLQYKRPRATFGAFYAESLAEAMGLVPGREPMQWASTEQ